MSCEPCSEVLTVRKTLAAHGVLMSDERLPHGSIQLSPTSQLWKAESWSMERKIRDAMRDAATSCWKQRTRESTTSATRRKWKRRGSRGRLRTNSFIRLRKLFSEGRPAARNRRSGRFRIDLTQQSATFARRRNIIIRRGIGFPRDAAQWITPHYQRALHPRAGITLRTINVVEHEASPARESNRGPLLNQSHEPTTRITIHRRRAVAGPSAQQTPYRHVREYVGRA